MQYNAFDAIIFDCDGVLVDTERLINEIWQRMLGELGLHLTFDEMHHYLTGKTTETNLTTAAELLGAPLPADFHRRLKDEFRREIQRDVPLIPHIRETLESLNLPKATATNALREDMLVKLQRSGLDRYFEHCVCVEDVQRPKPAPDIYLHTAEKLEVDPARCAVVEDSPTGIAAATAAGMTVFGYCADMDAGTQIAAGAIKTFPDMRLLNGLLANH